MNVRRFGPRGIGRRETVRRLIAAFDIAAPPGALAELRVPVPRIGA